MRPHPWGCPPSPQPHPKQPYPPQPRAPHCVQQPPLPAPQAWGAPGAPHGAPETPREPPEYLSPYRTAPTASQCASGRAGGFTVPQRSRRTQSLCSHSSPLRPAGMWGTQGSTSGSSQNHSTARVAKDRSAHPVPPPCYVPPLVGQEHCCDELLGLSSPSAGPHPLAWGKLRHGRGAHPRAALGGSHRRPHTAHKSPILGLCPHPTFVTFSSKLKMLWGAELGRHSGGQLRIGGA